MISPRIFVTIEPSLDAKVDFVIVGVQQSESGPQLFASPGYEGVTDHFEALGVTGATDQLVRLPAPAGAASSLALIGLGKTISHDSLRSAAGSAVRQLTGTSALAFAFPLADETELEAVLTGAALGAYSYTEHRSRSLTGLKLPASEIAVHTDERADGALQRATTIAGAVSLVKDLVNAPPSHLFPESLATHAVDAVERLITEVPALAGELTITVWDEAKLVAEGFGGIAGVGQGSSRPPRLVKVSYSPAHATKHLALVGKGITFDTGGLSLKPPASMVGMKYDMAGAATVLAVTLAAARLAVPVRLTAWLCIAENMPSGTAIRPNDVLHMRNGSTVEVLNTDAEGRLVLADGLAAASEEFPDAIIDVATLTGAAIVALGTRYSAVMGEKGLVDQYRYASVAAGEFIWPMPLPEEMRALLNSDVADIANAKIGNTGGGMLLAGVFLRDFIGKTSADANAPAIPWAHLDIAGTADNSGAPSGFTGSGPTGVTVRALIQLAEDFSRS
jgi:leucyl aminopeptidase